MESEGHILWWERSMEGGGHILWWERVMEGGGHILWWERVMEGGNYILSRSMEKKKNGHTLCIIVMTKLKGDLRTQKTYS